MLRLDDRQPEDWAQATLDLAQGSFIHPLFAPQVGSSPTSSSFLDSFVTSGTYVRGVRRFLGALLATPVVVVVSCLPAAAGMYSPPGGDSPAVWLSNSVIVFSGMNAQTGVFDGIRTVDVDASPI